MKMERQKQRSSSLLAHHSRKPGPAQSWLPSSEIKGMGIWTSYDHTSQ